MADLVNSQTLDINTNNIKTTGDIILHIEKHKETIDSIRTIKLIEKSLNSLPKATEIKPIRQSCRKQSQHYKERNCLSTCDQHTIKIFLFFFNSIEV